MIIDHMIRWSAGMILLESNLRRCKHDSFLQILQNPSTMILSTYRNMLHGTFNEWRCFLRIPITTCLSNLHQSMLISTSSAGREGLLQHYVRPTLLSWLQVPRVFLLSIQSTSRHHASCALTRFLKSGSFVYALTPFCSVQAFLPLFPYDFLPDSDISGIIVGNHVL